MLSMVFETASVSGTFSSSTTVDAGHRLERLGGDPCVHLVPAEIIARADIDDADGERRRAGEIDRKKTGGEAESTCRAALEQPAARNIERSHEKPPV